MTGDPLGWPRRAWRAVARQGALGVGVALMGLAGLVSAAGWVQSAASDREQIDNLRRSNAAQTVQIQALTDELTCRSIAATEASNIQAEIGVWTGLGLSAFAMGNEAGLAEAAVEVDVLSRELGPALERRTESIEACQDGG